MSHYFVINFLSEFVWEIILTEKYNLSVKFSSKKVTFLLSLFSVKEVGTKSDKNLIRKKFIEGKVYLFKIRVKYGIGLRELSSVLVYDLNCNRCWQVVIVHLVFCIRWDSNPQPLDCESSLLTIRPDLRPFNGEVKSLYVSCNCFNVCKITIFLIMLTCLMFYRYENELITNQICFINNHIFVWLNKTVLCMIFFSFWRSE